jgi:hypothetical protein
VDDAGGDDVMAAGVSVVLLVVVWRESANDARY